MRNKFAAFVLVALILQIYTVFQLQTKAYGQVPYEFLRNGDFSQGLEFWMVKVESGTLSKTYNGPDWLTTRPLPSGWTDIQLVNESGRTNVLEIVQTVNDGDGDWTGVYQTLIQDVSRYSELWFRADGKAMNQSLPGDGKVGGEYPVHFIIQYQDVNGVDHDAFLNWPPNPAWQQGFYYTAVGDPDGKFNPYSYLVTQNVWFHANSSNLMNLSPAPKIIKTVYLYSSGWAYHGRIDNVRLFTYQPSSTVSQFSDALLILPLVFLVSALGVLRWSRKHPPAT